MQYTHTYIQFTYKFILSAQLYIRYVKHISFRNQDLKTKSNKTGHIVIPFFGYAFAKRKSFIDHTYFLQIYRYKPFTTTKHQFEEKKSCILLPKQRIFRRFPFLKPITLLLYTKLYKHEIFCSDCSEQS